MFIRDILLIQKVDVKNVIIHVKNAKTNRLVFHASQTEFLIHQEVNL
jgi:hypothetical protein